MEEKLINVDKILAEKAPNMNGFLKKIIATYLKRIAHEAELNDAIARFENIHNGDFLDAAFGEFSPILAVEGIENVPTSGGCIIAANHPLGGLDGICLMHVIAGNKRGIRKDIKFIVNDLLLHIKNFAPYFIPINKLGKSPTEYLRRVDEVYASDTCVLIFPAGLCSRKQENGIEDLAWNKSFISKAVKYQKDIIPCYVTARNSNWFYNLAKIRNYFKVKVNVEMLYLADEMYGQKGKDIKFTFGKPIPWQTFDKSKNDAAWAQAMKDHVYAIGGRGALRF